MNIDLIDQKLLELMQEDARISISEISKRINLSLSAVSERLKKLEQSGIIVKYTTILDSKAMEKNLAVIAMLCIDNPLTSQDFTKYVLESDNIISAIRIAGDFDYMLKLAVKDQESLEKELNNLKALRSVKKLSTSLILGSLKENYSVPPVAVK